MPVSAADLRGFNEGPKYNPLLLSETIDPDAGLKYRKLVRNNPVWWTKTALGVDLWYKQREIIEAVRDNKLVAVKSANGVGKSYLAAVITIWYLNWKSPGYVILSSSSWQNVSKTLWPEIRRILTSAPCKAVGNAGEFLSFEWKLGDHWGAFSVGTKKAENFSGFRAPNGCMVIVDEASSLEPAIHEAIMGLVSVPGSRVLYIGNPIRTNCPFFNCFRNDSWKTFGISAFDSPNVRLGKNILPGLSTMEWIIERQKEWGVDHPAYAARVRGEFPDEGQDTLISLFLMESAVNRDSGSQDRFPVVMGVDVARFGDDRTVIIIRQGYKILHIESHSKEDLMQTVGRIRQAANKFNPDEIRVDEIGVGGGVVDRLNELYYSNIVGVNVSNRASDATTFYNTRAEGWWETKKWLERGAGIPDHEGLKRDLCAPRLMFNSSSQIQLENKLDTKKRLGFSPDFGDALMLTHTKTDLQKIYAAIVG